MPNSLTANEVSSRPAFAKFRGLLAFLALLLFVGCIVVAVAPAAQAASYTYANARWLANWEPAYSGTHDIRGGEGSAGYLTSEGVDPFLHIETYYDYPGYSQVSSTDSSGTAYFTHLLAPGSKSKCYWYFA